MSRTPDLLPYEVLDLRRDILGPVASPGLLRHAAPEQIQGVHPEAPRQLLEVLAELGGGRPRVDAVHQEQRFALPGHRVREVTTLPPVVARLAAEPARRLPDAPLQPPVVEREAHDHSPSRKRRPQLHPSSSKTIDAPDRTGKRQISC